MKNLLIIFLTIFSYQVLAQKTNQQITDDLKNINVPKNKTVLPKGVQDAILDVINAKEITPNTTKILIAPKLGGSVKITPILVSPSSTAINMQHTAIGRPLKNLIMTARNRGGQAKNFTIKYPYLDNATSYELKVSKTPDMLLPTTYYSFVPNFNLINMDTLTRYYTQCRGKSAIITGDWSDLTSFDTHPLPKFTWMNSFYDLVDYDPLITELSPLFPINERIAENVTHETVLRLNEDQIYARKFTGLITTFPYMLTNFSVKAIIKIDDVISGTVTYPAWTMRDPEPIDLRANITKVGNSIVVSLPSTLVFPVVSVDFTAGIYFTQN